MKYRHSSWLIRNEISDTEEIWLHGYTGAVDIVEKNSIDSPSKETTKQMLEKGYLVIKTVEEEKVQFMNILNEIESIKTSANTYVIQFTISCNFACAYCSENSARRISGYKSEKIKQDYFANIEQVIQNQSADTTEDKMILFGGEPLLMENYLEVERAVSLFKHLGMKDLEVITNGYYADKFIDIFKSTNAVFQITLDGTKEVHDKRRIEKKTKHSFLKIIDNVQLLLSLGHTIYLRINVDHSNKEDIPKLFDVFIGLGLNKNDNFKPYLGYTHDYGKYENQTTTKELYDYFCTFQPIEEFGISRDPFGLEKALENHLKNDEPFEFKSTYCGANKGNMFMFAPDGKLHACWDASPLDKEIGIYYPQISLDSETYKNEWLNRKISKLPVCQDCKYALFCGGGCQYMAKNETDDYYSPHCNGYQAVFNDVLVHIASEL